MNKFKNIMERGKAPAKLHFGCGTNFKEGWFNLDTYVDSDHVEMYYEDLKNTWIVEGMLQSPHDLPFQHFDYIFAEMVFEHIHPDHIPNTMFCLYHALKPKGVIKIIVPNFYYHAKLIVHLEESLELEKISYQDYIDGMRNVNNEMLDPTYGHGGYARGHQSVWTERLGKKWLQDQGFVVINVEDHGDHNFYLHLTAMKSEGNPYGSPVG
jgi:SAM-dependent methyltransferase